MSRYYKHNGIDKASVTTISGQLKQDWMPYWVSNCWRDYLLDRLPSITNTDELPNYPAGSVVLMSELQPLIEAAASNWREASKTAMHIGSQVHDAIETYIATGREPFKPGDEVTAGFLAFLEWMDEYQVKAISSEQTVYADRYAGTLDLHCYLNGKRYVVDFKTTAIKSDGPAYLEHRYQVAAYRACVGAEGCGILYLHKQTGYPHWRDTSSTYAQDLRVFEILVELWYASHPNVNKRIVKQKEAA
jgi:hypothetical protein